VCVTEPLVAVTVSGYEVVMLPGVEVDDEDELLFEHPLRLLIAAIEPTTNSVTTSDRNMPALSLRRKQSGSNSAATNAMPPYAMRDGASETDAELDSESVSVTVCDPDVAERVDGENELVTKLGNPVTAKFTAPG
jgi:hypothetical protein